MGQVIELVDTSDFEEKVEKYEKYLEEEAHQAERLSESASFSLVYAAKKYDDWYLDPIVGFIIPGFGDVLSAIAAMPGLYVAMFKLRSFKLTLAILYAQGADLLVGLVPFAGDVVDAFYKASKISARLIVGYAEKDPATLEEIDKRVMKGTIGLIALVGILWLFFSAIVKFWHWLVN